MGLEPGRRNLEPAGRGLELAETDRAAELAEKASDPAGRASEPAGRAFEPPVWVSEPAGRVLLLTGTDSLGPSGRDSVNCESLGARWEPREGRVETERESQTERSIPGM